MANDSLNDTIQGHQTGILHYGEKKPICEMQDVRGTCTIFEKLAFLAERRKQRKNSSAIGPPQPGLSLSFTF